MRVVYPLWVALIRRTPADTCRLQLALATDLQKTPVRHPPLEPPDPSACLLQVHRSGDSQLTCYSLVQVPVESGAVKGGQGYVDRVRARE